MLTVTSQPLRVQQWVFRVVTILPLALRFWGALFLGSRAGSHSETKDSCLPLHSHHCGLLLKRRLLEDRGLNCDSHREGHDSGYRRVDNLGLPLFSEAPPGSEQYSSQSPPLPHFFFFFWSSQLETDLFVGLVCFPEKRVFRVAAAGKFCEGVCLDRAGQVVELSTPTSRERTPFSLWSVFTPLLIGFHLGLNSFIWFSVLCLSFTLLHALLPWSFAHFTSSQLFSLFDFAWVFPRLGVV